MSLAGPGMFMESMVGHLPFTARDFIGPSQLHPIDHPGPPYDLPVTPL